MRIKQEHEEEKAGKCEDRRKKGEKEGEKEETSVCKAHYSTL